MEAHYLEKMAEWRQEIVTTWFPLVEFPHALILGTFTRTSMELKHKWLSKRYVKNVGWGWVTPADIARLYLDAKYGKQRRRMNHAQYQAFWENRRAPPLAARPCKLESAVYIDILSAYWSILKRVGWDVDYSPERWIGVRSSVLDFPYPDIKLARNCLVSAGLPTTLRIWTGDKVIFQKKGNKYINMVLWGLCMDVLNGLACDMLEAGAVYVHTDGYIITSERLPLVDEIFASWGLDYTIKGEGRAEVRSVGEYTIGDRRPNFKRETRSRAHWKVYDPGRKWLRGKIQRLSLKVDK